MRVRRTIRYGIHHLLGDFLLRQRAQRVIMVHGGRSGSTVVASLLAGHPQIYWASELLKRPLIGEFLGKEKPFDYIKHIQRDEIRTMKSCYGFEMKYAHMRLLGISKEAFIRDVSAIGFHNFVMLTRRNTLRKIVSSELLKIKGYAKLHINKSPELRQVALNTDKLIQRLDQNRHDVEEMQSLLSGQHLLHLYYEDDVESNPVDGYARICTFLNLPIHPASPKIRRVNPFPLHQMIQNFHAVAETLSNTEYAWMLELDKP